MNTAINSVLFYLLMLLVVISPLPLGSNREWSCSLCALFAGGLGLVWVVGNLGSAQKVESRMNPLLQVLFTIAVSWVLVQIGTGTPAGWHHPLWSMAGSTRRRHSWPDYAFC